MTINATSAGDFPIFKSSQLNQTRNHSQISPCVVYTVFVLTANVPLAPMSLFGFYMENLMFDQVSNNQKCCSSLRNFEFCLDPDMILKMAFGKGLIAKITNTECDALQSYICLVIYVLYV